MHGLRLVLILALLSSACFRSTTTIDLKPDGSGTIVQETGISAQALAMIKGLGAGQPGQTGEREIFGEDQARKAASMMGVTFVSGEAIKTGELEGYRARYTFDDVTKVKVNMTEGPSGAGTTAAKQPPFGFSLARGTSSSVLTIQLPEDAAKLPANLAKPAGTGPEPDKAQAAQAIALMKMMMKGLFVDVTLNVNGRILKSNAPYVEGSRVTLLQLDFDKLLAEPGALEKLQSASDLKTLSKIPGMKVPTERTVTIEFAR